MLSLQLFNAVLADPAAPTPAAGPRIVDTLPLGYVIAPSAAHRADEIVAYYSAENLTGEQLNQTFHQSWQTVLEATREELLGHQLLHYLSTYGFAEMGIETDYIYLPPEVSEVPELAKAPVRVIHGLSADELAGRCLALVESGVALAAETLADVLALLAEIDRVPASTDGIRNREFLVLLADAHGVLPAQPTEFLRYLVYQATGSTLLIKNRATIRAIRAAELPVADLIATYGPERCAEIFLRFKPLWLAFKQYPKAVPQTTPEQPRSRLTRVVDAIKSATLGSREATEDGAPSGHPNAAAINRISKLAGRYHRPLPADYLNGVTALDVVDPTELTRALDGANAFRKIRLLYALHTRRNDGPYRMYRIRNGKSYVVESPTNARGTERWGRLYDLVFDHLVAGLDVAGKTFLVSPDVHYALPATEKMFVGNMPVGSYVACSEALAVGIYWRNDWGARDLDLSGQGISKVGWNAAYNFGGMTYSGDITDAPKGATELLRFDESVTEPILVSINVFSGKSEAAFKIVAGQAAEISANYTLRPDELRAEVKTTTTQRQQVIGIVQPAAGERRFVFVNVGSGRARVAGNVNAGRQALYHQWKDAPMLADVLRAAGAEVINDAAAEFDVDLRWEALGKDAILSLLV